MTRPLLVFLLAAFLNACAHFDTNTPGWEEFKQLMPVGTDIHLYYKELGRGDPLLLIHGFGASSYTWRHLANPLAQYNRVIRIDLKGFGESPKPIDRKYSIYDQARLVHQFIIEHELRNFTLVGNSFGGGVALVASLYLTEASPSWQKRLILIDSIGYRQKLPSFLRILATPVLGRLVMSLVPKTMQAHAIMKLAYYNNRLIPKDAVKAYATALDLPGAEYAILKTARQIIPPDIDELSKAYSKITYPTLLLWGREDEIVPLAIGQRLEEALPNSELVVLEQCGHLPQEEKPAETLAAIERFLPRSVQTIE
jgi:Predicted hydrolases or acyltransferases (alpha/beta hydrolase superfamily)